MKHLPLIIILTLLFTACKTRYITQTEVVEVPVTHVELRTDTLHDSIHQTDSVIIYTKGDTVYQQKIKNVIKWRDRVTTVDKVDTIVTIKPVNIPVEVEKELTNWQKAKMALGEVVMILLGAAILHYIYKIYRRWKK